MPIDLSRLNPQQRQAAETIHGPLLIIAGAGSGKTSVITFRIANMLEHHIPQNAILALTFTNKAAREMEERVKDLTKKKLSNLTVSTFHAFGVQVLREKGHILGYRPHFTIYDQSDSEALLKESARALDINLEPAEVQAVLNLFSGVKTRRRGWEDQPDAYKKLYAEFEDHLKLYNALDFDDLIMKPIDLFENHPEVLEEYRQRYKYILVDEFQDTSLSQFRIVELLALNHRNLCVVGDDDQSIYSWRGANYQNIVMFETIFNERVEIKLEQNYRSTGVILAAANSVIANNTNRKEKELWTGTQGGRSIEHGTPEDEVKEAEFIAQTIKTLMIRENRKYDDFGILVRTNSLTKNIEVALLQESIPYRVSGGTSFFQRREVKDILSYLRLILNPDDDMMFLRIINTPRRGIGKTTLEHIVSLSTRKKVSHLAAIKTLIMAHDSPLPDKAKAELSVFLDNIAEWQRQFAWSKGKKYAPLVRDLVETIDYWGHLLVENPKSAKAAEWKYKNVETLIGFLEDWENNPDNPKPDLGIWLNRVTLSGKDDDADEGKGAVNLMTIHASKGLEFDVVFIAGVEDKVIPHEKSVVENPEAYEEERRLFYVAITRARKHLYMTSCKTRRTMTETWHPLVSPFLSEIPENLVQLAEMEHELEEDEADDLFEKLKNRFG